MITLDDKTLEECRQRASIKTTQRDAVNQGLCYIDLLTINYGIELEVEVCYAIKEMRYLR